MPNDIVFGPFAGTGTTLVTAKQSDRNAICVKIDPEYVQVIKKRLNTVKAADDILKYAEHYRYTPELKKIWPSFKYYEQETIC